MQALLVSEGPLLDTRGRFYLVMHATSRNENFKTKLFEINFERRDNALSSIPHKAFIIIFELHPVKNKYTLI